MDTIFRHYLFAIIALSFALGILIGTTGAEVYWALFPMVSGVSIWVLLRNISRTPEGAVKVSRWRWTWVSALFISGGMLSQWYSRPTDSVIDEPGAFYLYGRITDIRPTDYGQRLTIDLEGATDRADTKFVPLRNIRARITIPSGKCHSQQRIIFINSLRRIDEDPNYQHIKRGPAPYRAEWSQRVGEEEYLCLDTVKNIRYYSENAQSRLSEIISESGLQASVKHFLSTLLLGKTDSIDDDTRRIFADAGISHILAVSGMHIGIISTLIYLLTAPLVLLRRPKMRYPIVALLTWGYVFISGFHISATRAAIMVTASMAAMMTERKISTFNILCLALFLLLLADPMSLFDVGLQLSFVCVASLMAFGQYLDISKFNICPTLRILCLTVLTSVIAVFGSWAITAYYFKTIPLMFIPVNLIALPLLPLYMVLSLFHLAMSACGWHCGWVIWLLDNGYEVLISICRTLTSGTVVHLNPGFLTPLLWCAGLILIVWGLHFSRRKTTVAGVGILLAAIAAIFIMPGETLRNGLIVRDYTGRVAIGCYSGGSTSETTFDTGKEGYVSIGRKRIYVVGIGTPRKAREDDMLVITDKFRGDIDQLVSTIRPSMLIVHPSVWPDRCDEIVSAAARHNVESWQLSEDGPLHLLEP